MKRTLKSISNWVMTLLVMAIVLAYGIVVGVPGAGMPVANAATANYETSVGDVDVIVIPISGQYTASTVSVATVTLPYPAKVLSITATARASGGTTPTLTVDVQDDGTSILSSAVSVTAGSISSATISSSSIADESVIDVDLAIGGTSPTWNDITVTIVVLRR